MAATPNKVGSIADFSSRIASLSEFTSRMAGSSAQLLQTPTRPPAPPASRPPLLAGTSLREMLNSPSGLASLQGSLASLGSAAIPTSILPACARPASARRTTAAPAAGPTPAEGGHTAAKDADDGAAAIQERLPLPRAATKGRLPRQGVCAPPRATSRPNSNGSLSSMHARLTQELPDGNAGSTEPRPLSPQRPLPRLNDPRPKADAKADTTSLQERLPFPPGGLTNRGGGRGERVSPPPPPGLPPPAAISEQVLAGALPLSAILQGVAEPAAAEGAPASLRAPNELPPLRPPQSPRTGSCAGGGARQPVRRAVRTVSPYGQDGTAIQERLRLPGRARVAPQLSDGTSLPAIVSPRPNAPPPAAAAEGHGAPAAVSLPLVTASRGPEAPRTGPPVAETAPATPATPPTGGKVRTSAQKASRRPPAGKKARALPPSPPPSPPPPSANPAIQERLRRPPRTWPPSAASHRLRVALPPPADSPAALTAVRPAPSPATGGALLQDRLSRQLTPHAIALRERLSRRCLPVAVRAAIAPVALPAAATATPSAHPSLAATTARPSAAAPTTELPSSPPPSPPAKVMPPSGSPVFPPKRGITLAWGPNSPSEREAKATAHPTRSLGAKGTRPTSTSFAMVAAAAAARKAQRQRSARVLPPEKAHAAAAAPIPAPERSWDDRRVSEIVWSVAREHTLIGPCLGALIGTHAKLPTLPQAVQLLHGPMRGLEPDDPGSLEPLTSTGYCRPSRLTDLSLPITVPQALLSATSSFAQRNCATRGSAVPPPPGVHLPALRARVRTLPPRPAAVPMGLQASATATCGRAVAPRVWGSASQPTSASSAP